MPKSELCLAGTLKKQSRQLESCTNADAKPSMGWKSHSPRLLERRHTLMRIDHLMPQHSGLEIRDVTMLNHSPMEWNSAAGSTNSSSVSEKHRSTNAKITIR